MGFNAVNAFMRGGGNYLARKQIDKRVSLLCHLDGNLDPITGNTYSATNAATFVTGGWGMALSFVSGMNVQYTVPLLDLSGDFTIEAWAQGNNSWNSTFVTVGSLEISTNGGSANWNTKNVWGYWGVENAVAGGTPPSWNYVTLCRNGSTMRLFSNGIFKKSGNEADSSDYSGARTITFVGNGNTFALSHIRVLSGVSIYTTGNTVPVPTAPYTGYEVL